MPPESPSPTHSPLPWGILVHDGDNIELVDAAGNAIIEAHGDDMAHLEWSHEGDLSHIRAAVNAYPVLRTCADALRALIDTLDGLPLSPLGEEGSGKIERSIRAADAALAALPTEVAR